MNINEIAIYLKDKPDYISILNELIDYIIIEKKNLYLKTAIIDDWNFTNEKEVEGLEKEYREDKIYLIEIFIENERIFNFKLYRDQQYIIDIYFDQYIANHDVKMITQILISILKEYIFIAIGEDFLLEYNIDMSIMKEKSSGIDYWIIPSEEQKDVSLY